MKNGVVVFAGAGPGAPDLITLRGRKAVEEADLIIYAGSLVNPEILSAAKPGCEIHDSSKMDLGEMVERMAKGAKDGLKVLRLHTGDPSIYGAIGEQMRELDKLGVPYEVVPGVSSVFASAAALRAELTIPGISQTVILTRLAGRTPVPEGQDIRGLAAHKATMAIFLSILDIAPLAKELVAGGYPESTAVAIVHRASWSDERILRGTLADIAAKAAAAKLGRQAMIIVGDSLRNEGERSKLYDAAFTHGWREATRTPAVETPSAESRDGGEGSVPPSAIAVYAITENGARTAAKIGAAFPEAELFVFEKFASGAAEPFAEGELPALLSRNWRRCEAHVFIMAAGIAVRKIAPLLRSKLEDPAVLVCDDSGRHCVSLAGGHIGGANRLAREIAAAIGAEPVITTATDAQGLKAFDELAAENGWRIENPSMIKRLNSMLLEKAKIGVLIPREVFAGNYEGNPKLTLLRSPDEDLSAFDGLVILSETDLRLDQSKPVLRLLPR